MIRIAAPYKLFVKSGDDILPIVAAIQQEYEWFGPDSKPPKWNS